MSKRRDSSNSPSSESAPANEPHASSKPEREWCWPTTRISTCLAKHSHRRRFRRCNAASIQSISHSPDSANVRRYAWIRFDLFAQLEDVRVERAAHHTFAISPHLAQQFGACHDG